MATSVHAPSASVHGIGVSPDAARRDAIGVRRWALLQHYEACGTPCLDITQSLMVAATFALWSAGHKDRFVYVLGLHYPSGSITLNTTDDVVLLNLRALMPPDARRPHFQDGHLVACSPRTLSLKGNHDLAVRMIGKFRIPADAQRTFWSNWIPPLPKRFLMPEEDPVREWVKGLANRR